MLPTLPVATTPFLLTSESLLCHSLILPTWSLQAAEVAAPVGDLRSNGSKGLHPPHQRDPIGVLPGQQNVLLCGKARREGRFPHEEVL